MSSATKILKEDWEVAARLTDFGTSKAELVEVARKAAAARADSTEDDPIAGPGLLSWIYGTRALRATFRQKGWKRNRLDNIASVVDKNSDTKLIFQNADSACDYFRTPKAISDKKKATARLVASSQFSLFPEHERAGEELEDVGANVYYFLVCVDDGMITAELSSPRSIENNQFSGFHERIFIINSGDIEPVIIDEDDGEGQDFDVVVTSK